MNFFVTVPKSENDQPAPLPEETLSSQINHEPDRVLTLPNLESYGTVRTFT